MGTQMLTNNNMVNDLIQDAVLKICTEHMTFTRVLEVDGIVCISPENSRELVVKIHRTIVKPQESVLPTANHQPSIQSPQEPCNALSLPSDIDVMHPHPSMDNASAPQILEVHSLQKQQENVMPVHVQRIDNDGSFMDYEVTQNSPEPNDDLSRKDPSIVYYNEEGEVRYDDNEDSDMDLEKTDSFIIPQNAFKVRNLAGPPREIKEVPFACPVCKEIYPDIEKLEEHLPIHGLYEKFQCENCKRYFQRKCSLTLHLNKMTCRSDDVVIECNMCCRQFYNRETFKSHMKKHYGFNKSGKKRGRKGGKNIQCLRCDLICTSTKEYETHMKIHPVSKPYNCKICSKGFQSKGGLDMHMKRHRGEDPYKSFKKAPCEYCDRVCISKSALAIHMRMHSGDRPYKCRLYNCDKEFARKNDLQVHQMRYHSPEEVEADKSENENEIKSEGIQGIQEYVPMPEDSNDEEDNQSALIGKDESLMQDNESYLQDEAEEALGEEEESVLDDLSDQPQQSSLMESLEEDDHSAIMNEDETV